MHQTFHIILHTVMSPIFQIGFKNEVTAGGFILYFCYTNPYLSTLWYKYNMFKPRQGHQNT